MTREKLISLNKYKADLTAKLASNSIPAKHKDHPETYKNFLKSELATVSAKLASHALELSGK